MARAVYFLSSLEEFAKLTLKITALENEINFKEQALSTYIHSKAPKTDEELFREDAFFQLKTNRLTQDNALLIQLQTQLTQLTILKHRPIQKGLFI